MKGRSQSCVISLGDELRHKLILCAGLLRFAVVELRADFNDSIFAVDASNWGEAVAACKTSTQFVKEACRHSLKKGVWTRLLGPAAARANVHGYLDVTPELPGGPDEVYRSHPLWTTIFQAGQFGLVWRRGAQRRRHINIGEVKAFLQAEKAGKIRGKPSCMLIGGNSQILKGDQSVRASMRNFRRLSGSCWADASKASSCTARDR